MYEYTSIQEAHLRKAKLYLDRAYLYLNEKKYGHASGCLAKAAKKLVFAQHIGILTADENINNILQTMINTLSTNVAEAIISGTSINQIYQNSDDDITLRNIKSEDIYTEETNESNQTKD